MRFEPSSRPQRESVQMNGSARPTLSQPVTPRRTSFAITADDELKRHLEDEADDNHCLVSLSVRNVFGVPFEVSLHRKDGDEPGMLCPVTITGFNKAPN